MWPGRGVGARARGASAVGDRQGGPGVGGSSLRAPWPSGFAGLAVAWPVDWPAEVHPGSDCVIPGPGSALCVCPASTGPLASTASAARLRGLLGLLELFRSLARDLWFLGQPRAIGSQEWSGAGWAGQDPLGCRPAQPGGKPVSLWFAPRLRATRLTGVAAAARTLWRLGLLLRTSLTPRSTGGVTS